MDTEKDDTIDTIKDAAIITYTKVYKEVVAPHHGNQHQVVFLAVHKTVLMEIE